MRRMKQTTKDHLAAQFAFSRRDTFVTIAILLCATGLCVMLRQIDDGEIYVSELFLLAVFLISRFTNGYFYGIVAGLASVLAVNYIFTFPYFAFNFTISGYPLTILCMLAVSVVTSTMTTQIKRQSALRLEAEREKTRGNLLRAVSHDLRTPLTSILGASSAILENEDLLPKEERVKLMREIRDDSQWLIRMVENLLSITRIDGERAARIYKQPEAAEELVSAAVIKFKKRFPEQNVKVRVPDTLLMVPMDAMLIEQVIINLLENAVLHGKGATKIELTASQQNGEAVFEVRDNGCGIDAAILPHIFESGITTGSDGPDDGKRNLGIGLSVCHTIIRAHNGRMYACNLPEGGALFQFTLPMEDI